MGSLLIAAIASAVGLFLGFVFGISWALALGFVAGVILAGIFGAYLLVVLVGSIQTAGKTSWSLLPVLPLVFATYHFAYGLGFLEGIVDFVLLRRTPQQARQQITR